MSQSSRLAILSDVEKILNTNEYSIAKLSQGSKACFDIIAKKETSL